MKPWLEDRLQHSWLDPRKVTNKDEFLYQYAVAWGLAQGIQEILDFVKTNEHEAERLRKKEEGEVEQRIGE